MKQYQGKPPSIFTPDNIPGQDLLNTVTDSSSILKSYGASFKPEEYYWQVGEAEPFQGWILHLSVIIPQAEQLFHLIIPEILSERIPFKIIRDNYIASLLIDGRVGYRHLGKMMTIYPRDNDQACYCAIKLIQLTRGFRGPAIPTDRHLGSIVYTRYGSFQPAMVPHGGGSRQKCIYDKTGLLIPDPYTVPFNFPAWVDWPFSGITTAHPASPPSLLNGTFYPLFAIKKDAKGDVIKALYFKNFWQIKSCIIKQGRLNQFVDNWSRDIQDRLQWQYELSRRLNTKVSLPAIFDFFHQGDDAYLAIEYIKGMTMTQWIDNGLSHRHWCDLPVELQQRVLGTYGKLLDIIETLHSNGIIHRDITPDNFLIDRNKKLYPIDLELAWCSRSNNPDPPFTLGTAGFMSPEQAMVQRPDEKQDIYALGSTLMFMITNLMPVKFGHPSVSKLKEQFSFFSGSEEIARIIADCHHPDPIQRPALEDIRRVINNHRQFLPKQPPPEIPINLPKLIEYTINMAIKGLTNPLLTTSRLVWGSQPKEVKTSVANEGLEGAVYAGWHTGVAGPLWVLGLAKHAGFDVGVCDEVYLANWHFIQRQFFSSVEEKQYGLYMGGTGIALALLEGKTCGLLPPNFDAPRYLEECFLRSTIGSDLFSGRAGEGLALLYCFLREKYPYLQDKLYRCVIQLLKDQRPDGSWELIGPSGKNADILTGLDKGVAGIAWFLITYWEHYPDNQVQLAAIKALKWLIRKATKKQGMYLWSLSIKNSKSDIWGSGQGVPGIILVMIKAFEQFNEPIYREIAENYLQYMHRHPVHPDFTLGSGLAGLGELYLEGYRVFKDKAWKERADWIAYMLLNCFQEYEPGAGNWLSNVSPLVTSDLFFGNVGLIHFLLRELHPDLISHPLAVRK